MMITKLSPKQKRLLTWPYSDEYKALVCDGAVRSGKTVVMTTGFILWAMMTFDGQNFGICGKTVASAERNIIMPAQDNEALQDGYRSRPGELFLCFRGQRREQLCPHPGYHPGGYPL